MHNSPNRGVNYHIFENKGNYPVIPIYVARGASEIPYSNIERGYPCVTFYLLRTTTGSSTGHWRSSCSQCLYKLKANRAPADQSCCIVQSITIRLSLLNPLQVSTGVVPHDRSL